MDRVIKQKRYAYLTWGPDSRPSISITEDPMITDSYPDDNPKTVLGVQKVPMHLVPPSAKIALANAFADGATKYGPYNWREKKVSASVYYAAAQRHMDAWWDGEEVSDDALVHHIDHAMACLGIIKDALSIGMLNDDRPFKGAASKLQAEYQNNKKNKEMNGSTKELPAYGVSTVHSPESVL